MDREGHAVGKWNADTSDHNVTAKGAGCATIAEFYTRFVTTVW